MINNSEFHSPKDFKIFSFSEFHSLILKYEKKQRKKTLIFGIPLPSKQALSPLNKGINGFLKSILKYNKSLFYF